MVLSFSHIVRAVAAFPTPHRILSDKMELEKSGAASFLASHAFGRQMPLIAPPPWSVLLSTLSSG